MTSDALKTFTIAIAIGLAAPGIARAQSTIAPQDIPARDLPSNGGAGLRTPYITSNGSTVPDPGVSQGAGVTPMDRGIAAQDNKIDTSICKGC